MIQLKTTFTKRELIWFGPLFALFGGLIGALAFWKFEAPGIAQAIWISTAATIVLYNLIPPLRKPIYTGWLALVFPIGWIVSHLLLTIVFYLVVFPIGLLMRLLRYDALGRTFSPEAKSYWIKRSANSDPAKYFRQF